MSKAVGYRRMKLADLAHHPDNVRRQATDEGVEAHRELVASIEAHGLLTNLVVVKNPEEAAVGVAPYLVIAGGRRLEALRHLCDDGKWPEDEESVPVMDVTGMPSAAEVSLAENVVRLSITVYDEMEAFRRMFADGLDVSEIASRFARQERYVRQRLKLSKVDPRLREMFRDGGLTFDALCQFATIATEADQWAVYETIDAKRTDESIQPYNRPGDRLGGGDVRSALRNRRQSAGGKLPTFVGENLYVEAGGRIETDLFGDADHSYWLDGELVEKLANKLLDDAIDELELRDKWAWAEKTLDFTHEAMQMFVQAEKTPADPTEKELAEIDALVTLRDAAREAEDWNESRKHNNDISAIKQLIAGRATWPDEVRATAGCIVTVNFNGGLQVVEGLWKPGAVPEKEAEAHRDVYGALPGDPPPKKKTPKGPHGIGQKPLAVLRRHRTNVARAHMKPGAAQLLLGFEVVMGMFGERYASQKVLDIRFKDESRGASHEDDPVYEPLQEYLDALPLDWVKDDDPWVAWRGLAPGVRNKLFAAAVGQMLIPQLATDKGLRPEFETTLASLGIDWSSVRPTADIFWQRMTRAELMKWARGVLGPKWTKERATLKKAELVEAIEREFENPGKRKKVLGFTMPGFEPSAAKS